MQSLMLNFFFFFFFCETHGLAKQGLIEEESIGFHFIRFGKQQKQINICFIE